MNRLPVVLVLLFLCTASFAQNLYPNQAGHPVAPKVPSYMVFAGDTVRFDTDEKYERMDRELMSFCYAHTTSMLMLKRSGKYFPTIERTLAEYGIPDDFKYLCVIESALDPKALSSAGAAGMWQFTKATAAGYGLLVNSEVDERYNFEMETVAACRFIRDAYAKLKDWALVAAGYNCGQAGVARRVVDQRQASYFDLWLPEETNRYYYRILAAKLLFQNPNAFGFSITEADKYQPMQIRQTVSVGEGIGSLVDFAEKYGVSYAELKRANLWLRDNKLVNKEKRTFRIVIPQS